MKGCIVLAGTILLSLMTSPPALAGEWVYRGAGWCHHARYPWCHCGCFGPFSIYRHHPARDFIAAYYTSPRGVGRGYTTTAYSTSGRFRRYSK
jgi:hypothetical protein